MEDQTLPSKHKEGLDQMTQRVTQDDSTRRKSPRGCREEDSFQAGEEGPLRKGAVSPGCSRPFRQAKAGR